MTWGAGACKGHVRRWYAEIFHVLHVFEPGSKTHICRIDELEKGITEIIDQASEKPVVVTEGGSPRKGA